MLLPVLVLAFIPGVFTLTSCPDQRWFLIEGDCFLFVVTPTATFQNAQTTCAQQATYSTLAKINPVDPEYRLILERRPLTGIFAPQFLIGLSDTVTEGEFRWLDGTWPIDITWAAGHPVRISREVEERLDCVVINDAGNWENVQCIQSYSFVCSILDGTVPGTEFDECAVPGAEQELCPGTFDFCDDAPGQYHCDCFPGFFKNDRNECEDINECTTNPCLTNEMCTNFDSTFMCSCLPGHTPSTDPMVLGCIDIDECNDMQICIGFQENCTNFAGGFTCECNMGYVKDDRGLCVDADECAIEINPCTGEYEVCMNTLGSHVCLCEKYFHRDENDVCIPDDICCPAGFELIGTNCHIIIDQLKSYDGAREFCLDIGGALSKIFPLNAVTTYFLDNWPDGQDGMWIGLNDRQFENFFRWEADGDTLSAQLSRWGVGEPQNILPLLDCVFMTTPPSGTWHTSSCSPFILYAFVCQRTAIAPCPPVNRCEIPAMNPCDPTNEVCDYTYGQHKCLCKEGFKRNLANQQCEDVNECTEFNFCGAGFERCENRIGSFECTCIMGTQRKDGICQDINECEVGNPCLGNRVCENLVASYICVCALGYRLNRTECFDIDECMEDSHSCRGDGQYCTNLEGGYRCDIVTCLPGYFREGLECFDINECELGPCSRSNEYCVNYNGTFECLCTDGHSRDINNNCVGVCCPDGTMAIGEYCYRLLIGPEDIVDFPTALQKCQNGVANTTGLLAQLDDRYRILNSLALLDIDGDYWVGFEKDTQDRTKYRWLWDRTFVNLEPMRWRQGGPVQVSGLENCGLVNMNTFLLDNVYCGLKRPSLCQYRQISCDNSNPCETATPCENNPYTQCVYESGQIRCICLPGYLRDDITDRCFDIECILEDPDSCSEPNEICYFSSVNARGFFCDCKEFYQKGPDGVCVDIDECTFTICPGLNRQCVNIVGGYNCICREGFVPIFNGECVPETTLVNECAANPCLGMNVGCNDLQDGFTCVCIPGFRQTTALGNCEDINECDVFPGPCQLNSVCINLPGSFVCDCLNGYQAAEEFCRDINECLDSPCSNMPNMECINLSGSFECVCRDGFLPNEINQCIDVQECIENPNICDGENRMCVNTEGAHRCVCADGFDNIDGECVANPEAICFTVNSTCTDAENEVCINEGGLPTCICKQGYFLNDTVCIAESACNADANLCDMTSQFCIDTAPAEHRCECRTGYIRDLENNCIATDICATDNSLCTERPNEVCISLRPGVHECACAEGFQAVEGICTAVDVCLSSLSILCGPNELCQPTGIGMFNCSMCQPGFGRVSEDSPCEADNPCTDVGICGANEQCTNNDGVAVCDCIPGFIVQDGVCRPEDAPNPCEMNNVCGLNEQCILRATGSIICACLDGFVQQDGVCQPQQDKDLCNVTGVCALNEKCSIHNETGLVLCACLEGYVRQEGVCREAPNPCDTANICGLNEQCVLREGGSILCVCRQGFLQFNGVCQSNTDPCLFPNVCGANEVCVNNGAVAQCNCVEGFIQLNGACLEEGLSTLCLIAACGPNADCVILNEQPFCDCKEGFSKQDGICVPTALSECAGAAPCSSANEECVEANGFVFCECIAGFIRPLLRCVPQGGECSLQANDCPSDREVCVTVFTTPVCNCMAGYARNNNDQCIGITPGVTCEIGSDSCGMNEICIQQFGVGNVCICQESYDRNAENQCVFTGSICETNPNFCPSNANCVDDNMQEAGFRCVCVEGFVLTANGRCEVEITDICIAMPTLCSGPFEFCRTGQDGAHSCECIEGYWRLTPNAECTIMNLCRTNPCTEQFEECLEDDVGGFTCICSNGYERVTMGAACTATANNPCRLSTCADFIETCRVLGNNFVCDCINGYVRLTPDTDCIDPCTPESCTGAFELCQAQEGVPNGFMCGCIPGYTRPSPNEPCVPPVSLCTPSPCTRLNEVCERTGETESGFICNCLDGYSRNMENGECEASACASNTMCSGVNEFCQEGVRPGLFSCECLASFLKTSDGAFCVSSNADRTCASNPGLCPNTVGETCQNGNTPGEYRCECEQGFVRETATGKCIESSFTISTCQMNPEFCDAFREVCIDGTLPGSYVCECQVGYAYIEGVCSEQIACVGNPCLLQNEVCIDLPEGLFRCDCMDGYSRKSGLCEPLMLTKCTVLLDLCTDTEDCIDLEDNEHMCECKAGHVRFPDGLCYATCAIGVLQLCGNNAVCVDTPQDAVKYRCDCNFGYLKHEGRCFVSPTCASNPPPCGGAFEVCVDLLDTGTFRCDCEVFYHRVNGICTVRLDCCPSKGTFIEGLCYEFKNGEHSFSQAEQNCSLTGTGGHLAKVLPSQALQSFMLAEVVKLDLFFAWIGLTNSPEWDVRNGVFTWLSDRDTVSLNHPSWQGIPPDDACTVVDVDLAWKSSRCDLPTRLFCQYDAIPCVDAPPPMTSNECLTIPCTEENQICIDTPRSFICNCKPGTNEINNRCLYVESIEATMRIEEMNGVEAKYTRLLSDPSLTEFIQLTDFFCGALMNTLIKAVLVNDTTGPMETECIVTRYQAGSIITSYQVRVGEATPEEATDYINQFGDTLGEIVTERGETIFTADGTGNITIAQTSRDACVKFDCVNGACVLDESTKKGFCECEFGYGGDLCEIGNDLLITILGLLTSGWFGWLLFAIPVIIIMLCSICCYCVYTRRRKAMKPDSPLQTVATIPVSKRTTPPSYSQSQPLVHSMESAGSTPEEQRRRRRGKSPDNRANGHHNPNGIPMKKQPPAVASKPRTANGGPKPATSPGPDQNRGRSPQRTPSRKASPSPSGRKPSNKSSTPQGQGPQKKGPETGSLQRPRKSPESGSLERTRKASGSLERPRNASGSLERPRNPSGSLERPRKASEKGSLERNQNRASQRSTQSRASQGGGGPRPARPAGNRPPQRSPSRASQASNASRASRRGRPAGPGPSGGRNGPGGGGKPPPGPRGQSPAGSRSPNNRVRRKIQGGKVPKPNKGPETAPTIYI